MSELVTTTAGKVRGSVENGVYVYRGIPYAAPPFGSRRFLPPQPVAPWSGVRDVLVFGPKPPQPVYPPNLAPLLPPELGGMGKDCLTLNVWSPEAVPASHPVMVWIAGGLYAYHGTGASPWYDGSAFAANGVVLVTINYRVAADGFLYLGKGNANRGLLDQIAALAWVQQNIASFGGDPTNVTVFGESAGALSVGTLLGMPAAMGLFHKAILQSGAAHHTSSLASGTMVAEWLAKYLGVTPTRDAVSAVPTAQLLEAQLALEADLAADPDPQRWGGEVTATMLPWQPVVDGDIIPVSPQERIAAGEGAPVAVLAGTNTDEHRLMLVAGGMIDQVAPEMLATVIAGYGLPVEATLATYRLANPQASPGDLLAAIQSDWYWRIPAVRLAEAYSKRGMPTFMYEFAWPSPQFENRLGACHAIEIPFVFDTLGHGTEPLLGPAPPQPLADLMHAAWVRFATNGDPGWPAYDAASRATMRFGDTSAMVDDPRSLERSLWEGVR